MSDFCSWLANVPDFPQPTKATEARSVAAFFRSKQDVSSRAAGTVGLRRLQKNAGTISTNRILSIVMPGKIIA